MDGIKTIFPLLLCTLLVVLGQAQEVMTNEQGEKIIVYPDGSWKYFMEATDNDPFGGARAANQVDQPAFPAEASAQDVSTPEDRDYLEALQYAERVASETSTLEFQAEEAELKREYIEEDLSTLRLSEGVEGSAAIRSLEAELEAAQKSEWLAWQRVEKARELYDLAERMIYLKHKKRIKYYEERERLEQELKVLLDTQDPYEVLAKEKGVQKEVVAAPSYHQGTAPKQVDDCELAFDGVDEFTGKKRRDHESKLFFTYTRDDLKPYLKGKEYITCMGHITSYSGGLIYLTLEFTIRTPQAKYAFGGLPQNSILSVRMLDGESIRLINGKSDTGTYDPGQEAYVFRGQYQISAYQEKILKEHEVDMVRVVWQTGYEDYEVFELDFFRQQLKCVVED